MNEQLNKQPDGQQSTTRPGYLENQFLIAMPILTGSYFGQTVTYIWRHNEHGAAGSVINMPLRASVRDIFTELDIAIACSVAEEPLLQRAVLAGGPVERDKGFILHDAGDSWDASLKITPGVSVCTSKTILQDIATGKGPKQYLVTLGCVGWGPGQLEQEIGDNTWLTVPFNRELLYSEDHGGKLDAAVALLGIDLPRVSPDVGHS